MGDGRSTARTLVAGLLVLGAAVACSAQGRGPEPTAPAVRGEDGAEMVLVPAGEFWMGSDQAEVDRYVEACTKSGDAQATCLRVNASETPRRRVWLSAFSIDKYEVSNALYERFREAAGRRAPDYYSQFNEPRQPVVGVSWHDAEAYCRWAGKRLPTEAEWEKTARGTDGQQYPWGEQWDPSRANSQKALLRRTAPVGSYPSGVSPYGAHDMAGNVLEWVADWHDADYYKRSPERDPMGPESGSFRVVRGGAWSFNPDALRTAKRLSLPPGVRSNFVGIRCARGAP